MNPNVVLVVFVMEGCPACEAFEPTVRKLATKYQSCISTYIVDCNDPKWSPLADKHKISATPTTILFKKRGIAGRKEGMMEEAELEKWYVTGLQWAACEI